MSDRDELRRLVLSLSAPRSEPVVHLKRWPAERVALPARNPYSNRSAAHPWQRSIVAKPVFDDNDDE